MSLECEEFNRRLMQIMQNDPDRCLMCGTDFGAVRNAVGIWWRDLR